MKTTLVQPSISRDFAILTGVILFVLVLLSMWIIWSTHAEQSHSIITQLEKEADRVDRTLEREVYNASYFLDAIAAQIKELDRPDKRSIAKILQSYRSHSRVYAIWAWTDESKSVVVSSNYGVLDDPVDISDRDYIQKSEADPWRFVIGAPIEGRVSNRWVLPVSLGITDETGRYIGSVTASLDIQELTTEISDLVKRPGISFAILNSSMLKLTEVSETKDFIATYFPEETLESLKFQENSSGVISYADLLSKRSIYSYYKVSSSFPYILLMGYDAKYSQQAIETRLLPRLLQVISIAAFVLLFLWIVRSRVIRPVVMLTEVAANVACGKEYDFFVNKAPVEIDALANQIARLSDYIDERKRVEEELRDKLEIQMAKNERSQQE